MRLWWTQRWLCLLFFQKWQGSGSYWIRRWRADQPGLRRYYGQAWKGRVSGRQNDQGTCHSFADFRKKGILHAENVNDNSKTITLEQEQDENQNSEETWTGGYDEEGNYTGEGEYDENGNYVGPKPQSDLEYAKEKWIGGYDEEGDYTGSGEYDANGNYVGEAPTEESMAAKETGKVDTVRMAVMMEPANMTVTVIM